MDNSDAFLRKYSAVLHAVWRDDVERSKLLADPTRYALAAGLPVAAGSVVEVDENDRSTPMSSRDIIAGWTATPGQHVIYAPVGPVADTAELSDKDLASVAAGLLCLIEIV